MDFLNSLFSLSATSVTLCGAFLITLLGYAFGSLKIKGLSLGTAGVFIAALFVGYVSTLPFLKTIPVVSKFYIENSEVTSVEQYAFLESIGLVLFVSAIGFIAGPSFFKDLKTNAKSYVPLAIIMILCGSVMAAAFAMIPGIETDFANGILSGALTSTPAFSAAKQVADSAGLVALGNAIAYPFGVIGVVLFVQIMPRVFKADMAKEREKLKEAMNSVAEASETKEEKIYISFDKYGFTQLGIAIVLGIVLGAIKIPLTGAGFGGACFSLGNTGGPLIVALVLGHFGHLGKLNLRIAPKIATIFRELGLTLFLTGAGFEGGVELVAQVQASPYGAMLVVYGFLAGAVMTVVPLFVGYFVATKFFKLSLLNCLGSLTGGMTSTPALGTLIGVSGTDDVAAPYASTYPVALVFVVIVSNLIGTFIV